MKNLKNSGKVLSPKEQKSVNGGWKRPCPESCYTSPITVDPSRPGCKNCIYHF